MTDPSPTELLVATTNPHKLDEIGAILEPLGLQVVGLDTLSGEVPEPVEDADTFEGNAQIKAIAFAKAAGRVCLADDSGLAVDALDGAPGVHSARYAGADGQRDDRDTANNAKLLAALEDVAEKDRSARFVCAMCIADPDGNVLATSRGEMPGRIAREPAGTSGFGYDPLLVVADGRTSAELSPEEKNAISHRGEAARAIAPKIAEILGVGASASGHSP